MVASTRGKGKGPGRPASKRAGKSLHVYLDGALRATLDEAVGITRRDLTAEVTVALEKHFTEMGLWPRKDKADDPATPTPAPARTASCVRRSAAAIRG